MRGFGGKNNNLNFKTMKKEIEQLIELAKEYVDFGKEMNLPDDHTKVRGSYCRHDWCLDGDKISIYFADNKETSSVYFGDVEIRLYVELIQMPYNTTSESLSAIYTDAKNYLDNHLKLIIEDNKITAEQEKADRIAKLEEELKTLKA